MTPDFNSILIERLLWCVGVGVLSGAILFARTQFGARAQRFGTWDSDKMGLGVLLGGATGLIVFVFWRIGDLIMTWSAR